MSGRGRSRLRDMAESLRGDGDGVLARLVARTRRDLEPAEENRHRVQKVRHVDGHGNAREVRTGKRPHMFEGAHVLCFINDTHDRVIDHAIVCVVDEAEDVRALEHMRSLTRAHFAGIPMPIHMPDFLHAMAILLGGFQVAPRSRYEPREDPIAIAAERLRHVAQSAAAAAAHSAPSPDLEGDREEAAAAALMNDRPKRRSKPRRPKATPSAAQKGSFP